MEDRLVTKLLLHCLKNAISVLKTLNYGSLATFELVIKETEKYLESKSKDNEMP